MRAFALHQHNTWRVSIPSYLMNICNSFPKSYSSKAWNWQPASIAEVKTVWSFICVLPYTGWFRRICITLGNDSMSDSKQKSSYEHGSDFEWLRSYGHFLIPVHALMWTALTEPAGSLWLTTCIASINFASWLAHITTAVHNRAAACVAAVASFSKTSFKHRSIQIKGNFTKLTLHLYFKCIMYYAGLLFCTVYCQ